MKTSVLWVVMISHIPIHGMTDWTMTHTLHRDPVRQTFEPFEDIDVMPVDDEDVVPGVPAQRYSLVQPVEEEEDEDDEDQDEQETEEEEEETDDEEDDDDAEDEDYHEEDDHLHIPISEEADALKEAIKVDLTELYRKEDIPSEPTVEVDGYESFEAHLKRMQRDDVVKIKQGHSVEKVIGKVEDMK